MFSLCAFTSIFVYAWPTFFSDCIVFITPVINKTIRSELMWRAPDQSCLIQRCFYWVSEGRWFLPSSRYDHGNNVNKRSNRQRLRPLMDQMDVESGSVDGHKSQIHSSLWWATSLLPNHGIGPKHTRKSWCAPLIESECAECKAHMQNCEHVWEHGEIMHDLFLCVVGPFFFFTGGEKLLIANLSSLATSAGCRCNSQ